MSRRAALIRWRALSAPHHRAREQGVTIIVTTHFMQERSTATVCDHGFRRILAQGSPAQVRELARTGAMPSRAWMTPSLPS